MDKYVDRSRNGYPSKGQDDNINIGKNDNNNKDINKRNYLENQNTYTILSRIEELILRL